MKHYDVIIIGAGPGGIFASYELTKKQPSLSIAVFEEGHKLSQRKCPIDGDKIPSCINCKSCSIMSGFGGAGAFSDGKYNITNDFGGTLYEHIGKKQALDLMKYVDDIKLGILNNYIYVDNINFRESICKPCNELFDAGYIDVKTPVIFGNIVGQIRFSNYLPEKEIGKHIMRLRQYYDVGFEEATYYVEDRIFYFNFIHDDRAIVRVFPMEDYTKIDPDIKMKEYKYGIIYIRGKDEFQMQDINTAFDYIPDETNDCVIYTKEPVPIEIGVKPVKKELLYEEE